MIKVTSVKTFQTQYLVNVLWEGTEYSMLVSVMYDGTVPVPVYHEFLDTVHFPTSVQEKIKNHVWKTIKQSMIPFDTSENSNYTQYEHD